MPHAIHAYRRLYLLAYLFIPIIASQSFAQFTPSVDEKVRHGLYPTDRGEVNCDSIEDTSGSALFNTQVPILMQSLSSAYKIGNLGITYNFVRKWDSAAAVSAGACSKVYRGKGKRLVLIGENIIDTNQSDIEKKLILVSVLAHEMAHFKQEAINSKLVEKEVELHADFMAGWYLAQYVSTLPSLQRDERLRSVLAALSKFYVLGEDERPSAGYGTPENRLQIILEGYQIKLADADSVTKAGVELIKQNPVYRNLPDEVGTRIRKDLINITGQEDSLTIFDADCPGRVLTSDSKSVQRIFYCRVSPPNKLGSSQIFQNTDELYKALNKGFLSFLPPETNKTPGSRNTDFFVTDFSYPIRHVYISKLDKEINFGLTINIPLNKFPTKGEVTAKNQEAVELENQIFELAKKSRTLNIEKTTFFDKACRVTAHLENRLIICDFEEIDFEKKKEIIYSVIPKGFYLLNSKHALITWNSEENDRKDTTYYSRPQYLHSPVNFISLTTVNDGIPGIVRVPPVKLIVSISSDATIGRLVGEKKTLNSLGRDFDQKINLLSKSEEQIPRFTFRNTPCEVDETSKYGWSVNCQIKPESQQGETIESVFGEISDAIKSWAPIGWEEQESDIFYKLRQPKQFTKPPMASDVVVMKTKSFVKFTTYVYENNSKVKFGSSNPIPNNLGKDWLSQLKNLTNIDTNDTASFQLLGKECLVDYVTEKFENHITCTLVGSKASNKKIFAQLKEATISILPRNWKYRTEEDSFDAEKINGFTCPDTSENQSLMCYLTTIYFSINEKGALFFSIDFDNDDSKLNKP